MPFTSLNKTVNLLLIGLVTILLVALRFGSVAAAGAVFQALGTAGAAFLALPLAAGAIMVGMVVDRLSERLILARVARATERGSSRLVFRLTRSTDGLRAYQVFRDAALTSLAKSPWGTDLNVSDPVVHRTMIEAIVLRWGNKDSVEWALQHYASCRLACGFLFIAIIIEASLLIYPIGDRIMWLSIGCAVIYGLLTATVDQYLLLMRILGQGNLRSSRSRSA